MQLQQNQFLNKMVSQVSMVLITSQKVMRKKVEVHNPTDLMMVLTSQMCTSGNSHTKLLCIINRKHNIVMWIQREVSVQAIFHQMVIRLLFKVNKSIMLFSITNTIMQWENQLTLPLLLGAGKMIRINNKKY